MFLWTFDSSPQNSNFITVTQNFSAEGNVSLRANTLKDFLVNLNFSIIVQISTLDTIIVFDQRKACRISN